MTTKPSEAELRELERLVAAAPGEWAYVHGYGFNRHTSMDGPPTAYTRLAVAACNALPGLLARIRELEESLEVESTGWRAAEKRVAELLLSKAKLLAMGQEEMRRAEKAEATAADLVDFIATGDFTDDARRQAIAKAERALKPPDLAAPKDAP